MSLRWDIIQLLRVKPSINAKKEIQLIVNFLKNYLKIYPFFTSLVLGISGGQDSTLVGKLCQIAINELRKEIQNKNFQFIAIRLPYGSQVDEQDCQKSINFIKPDLLFKINIKESVLASEQSLHKEGVKINDFIRGNIKARERMKIQYSVAGMFKGMVVGTNHAAEAVTGFYTKYGDGGTDINPISHLNKRQGKKLLIELGCPESCYNKIPTGDLEDYRPSLPDETILGVTYEDIDNYLENKPISSDVSRVIERQYLNTKHKRRLPITIFDDF